MKFPSSRIGRKAMVRLLGLIGMLPEVDPSTWDHREVRIFLFYLFSCLNLTIHKAVRIRILPCYSLGRRNATELVVLGHLISSLRHLV
jgi:hypothetical protein